MSELQSELQRLSSTTSDVGFKSARTAGTTNDPKLVIEALV